MIYSDGLNLNELVSPQSLTKLCPNCTVRKYYKEFSYRPDGRLESWCRNCKNISAKERRKRHYLGKERERSWKRRGIFNESGEYFTEQDYTRWLDKQQNKCAICFKDGISFQRKLAVDHDHKTGLGRGLLCFKCNKGIGHFDEQASLFNRIITYLA